LLDATVSVGTQLFKLPIWKRIEEALAEGLAIRTRPLASAGRALRRGESELVT
jgi:hypothetical protein